MVGFKRLTWPSTFASVCLWQRPINSRETMQVLKM